MEVGSYRLPAPPIFPIFGGTAPAPGGWAVRRLVVAVGAEASRSAASDCSWIDFSSRASFGIGNCNTRHDPRHHRREFTVENEQPLDVMQSHFFTAGTESSELNELERRIRSTVPNLRKLANLDAVIGARSQDGAS